MFLCFLTYVGDYLNNIYLENNQIIQYIKHSKYRQDSGDVGDIGYYGNSEGLCGGGVSAVIGSDVDVHIANSVNTDFSF